jgi:acetolactate synthase-1/2/3 large subunit
MIRTNLSYGDSVMTEDNKENSSENLYKVSDIIAHLLAVNGVKTVFGVSGGASLHLLHAIHNRPDLRLITTHHEQAAAMAADSSARITNRIGVAIVTSGPGATNLITGIAGSYYDSIPTLFITGQVSTTRLSGNSGVRQTGFQETPITEIVKSITKYAIQITNPQSVIEQLEKCIRIAISDRPGPVLLDIPDDIQRMQVMLPEGLPILPVKLISEEACLVPLEAQLIKLKSLVVESQRPVIVLGWGVHLSGQEKRVTDALELIQWPTLLTWGAADMLPAECAFRIGTFGTHGNRDANFIIQNSDLIISIGARLDTKSTGSPAENFSRGAKKIMLDVDIAEIEKFNKLNLNIDLGLALNLRDPGFARILSVLVENAKPLSPEWKTYISDCQLKLGRTALESIHGFVEPYNFISKFSKSLATPSRIFVDTGCAIAWVAQAWEFKTGQRLFHDFNNTAMGWALPAAIASIADLDYEFSTIAIIGDGSFMMSLQELSTIKQVVNPIKIFILNNAGYSMIKQTQDQWFKAEYFASSVESGMHFPDFELLSKAFDIRYMSIKSDSEIDESISEILLSSDSVLCEVMISPQSRVIPQVKFGSPIEGMEPNISEELTRSLTIVTTDLGNIRWPPSTDLDED